MTLTAGCISTIIDEPQPVKIGVTAAHYDNVGQILRYFGAGADFHALTQKDVTNIETLKDFYALFINCGSHHHFDTRVLNSYVSQGGIIYVSDLAGDVLQEAFPGIIEFDSSESQVVSDANVVHSALASHMRVDRLDVIFDLSGWYAITNLDDNATVYIEGNLANRRLTPLAISFDYGEGTVFYTSFHNSAQATSHIINFVEYLIFRIKNVEVDRNLQSIAERENFVYRGAVFEDSALRNRSAAASADMAPSALFSYADAESNEVFENYFSEYISNEPESFRYTFEGKEFMLMFGVGNEFYSVTLVDPHGNSFVIDSNGEVTCEIIVADIMQPSITLEFSDSYLIRVINFAPGEWSFSAIPRNDSAIMIGIAVME